MPSHLACTSPYQARIRVGLAEWNHLFAKLFRCQATDWSGLRADLVAHVGAARAGALRTRGSRAFGRSSSTEGPGPIFILTARRATCRSSAGRTAIPGFRRHFVPFRIQAGRDPSSHWVTSCPYLTRCRCGSQAKQRRIRAMRRWTKNVCADVEASPLPRPLAGSTSYQSPPKLGRLGDLHCRGQTPARSYCRGLRQRFHPPYRPVLLLTCFATSPSGMPTGGGT